MKISSLLMIGMIGLSSVFTSCNSLQNPDNEGSIGGISSAQTKRQTKEDLYKWQDRTFRQLAY